MIVSLDLRAFISSLSNFFVSARCWTSVGVSRALKERPDVLALEAPRSTLAIADAPSSSSAQSTSYALVPVQPELRHDQRSSGRSIIALTRLYERCSSVESGAVAIASFPPSAMAALQPAIDIGVVRRVGHDADQLALNIKSLDWTTIQRAIDPVPLHLLGATDGNPLRLSKCQLIMLLRRDGWSHASGLDNWSPDLPLQYTMTWSRPASYFVALLHRGDIVGKGVGTIRHGGKDHYYKCLLKLSPERLLSMLADAGDDDHPDEWYKQFAIDDEAVEEDVADAEEDVLRLAVLDGAAEPPGHMLSILPPVAKDYLWTRCIAKQLGKRDNKVLFDRATDGTCRQRGWAQCPLHQCRLYRHCDEFTSREHMVAHMVLWKEAGWPAENHSRHEHLKWEPAAADVEALSTTIELHDY